MRQQIYIEVLTWEDYVMSHLEIFSPLSPEVAWTTAVTWTRWGHTGWWCWSRSTASGAARVWCTWCRCRSRGNTRTTSGFSPRVLLYRQKPSMIDKTLCTSGTNLATNILMLLNSFLHQTLVLHVYVVTQLSQFSTQFHKNQEDKF